MVLLGLLLCTCQSGCVERRLTIRSNPPGALVYVDDYEIGVTPVSTSFIYYGTRKIRLVKDGYETLTVMQSIPSPWYEYVPLDFVSENFVPGQIRDQRVLDFQLKPQMLVPTDQLLQRAEQLRRGVHPAPSVVAPAGGAVRPPAVGPPGPGEMVPAPQGMAPAPQGMAPAPQGMAPAPQGIGGQPLYPLPPRQ